MSKKVYSAAQRAKAKRLYKKGWGYGRIAGEIGCFPSTVRKWIKGGEITPHPGPKHSDAKRKAALAYYAKNDVSITAAAKHVGVHRKTLGRWIDESKEGE